LAEIRAATGDMTFLVPGIGAQGGDVAAAVRAGRTADGRGLLINSSRGILYASQGEDFADAARAAALTLRDEINQYR
jgi:orotidine-5'-phosphate decarboxylase